ncbi:MAG: M16 family metallopeptidase [Nitrospinota bacterium]
MEILKVNGYSAFYHKNHSDIVDLRFSVLAGSEKEDDPRIYGVSHFLEHLIFKGTQTRGYLDISDEIALIGGQSNAFTSKSVVSFYIRIIKMNWSKAFEILSDMFFNSVFDPKEIEKERNVILEEAKSNIDDNETFIMEEGIESASRPERGHRIIGTCESISGITRDDIVDYKNRHYKGDNILVSVSGNVEKEDLIRTLSACLPECEPAPKEIFCEETSFFDNSSLHLEREKLEQAYTLLFFKGFGRNHPLYDAQKIMLNALGGGMHSLLFKKVREEHGLCYNIDAGEVGSFLDSSIVCVSANLTKENVKKTKDLVLEIVEDIKKNGFDEKLINISKVDFTSYVAMSTETSTGYVMFYGISHLFNTYRNFDELYKALHAVTKDQIIEVTKSVFCEPKEISLS